MPKKTPSDKAADTFVQVVISGFPKRLREEYQREADRNDRSLAAEVRIALAERMAQRKQLQAA